jgi:hypothetical protein
MKEFFLIYKTTNLINNKFYIGYHKTTNLSDDYIGSGNILKKSIKKYGKNNFVKEILYVYPTREEALCKEMEIVNESFIKRKDTYNQKIGGEGGWDYINDVLIKDNNFTKNRNDKVSKIVKKLHKDGKLNGFFREDGTHILSPVNLKGRELSDDTKKLISINNGNKLDESIIKKRLDGLDKINKKRGYIKILSEEWGISHTQVRRFIKKWGSSSTG